MRLTTREERTQGREEAAHIIENEQLSERSGSNSKNTSRPPSTDSEAARAKRKSRKKSGKAKDAQPGHRKHDRALAKQAQLSDTP